MSTEDPLTPSPDPTGAPVFVDASGRRARRIRRLAAIIVLGCLGYGMALLIAALTGVPIEGAIVPYPAIGGHQHSDRPAVGPTNQPTPTGTSEQPSGDATPSATLASASAIPTAAHTTGRPSATTTAARTTGQPTATATATRGKSTTAPGVTHKPTTRPSHSRVLVP